MRYYYRGSTLLIRFKTKEMPDRQTITGYDIGATIMGYEGVVDAIDSYSFNVTFDEAITATLPEGHTPIVLSLTKDGVTALGQVKGLAAVEPSINETCGVTDIVTCEVTIEDVTLNYGMVFNNVVTYQDLTDEQKTAMMAGIQSDADELFAELATHPPIIQTGTWHYWDASTNVYVDTNIAATPYENYLQNTTDNPPLTEAQWSVWSKEQGDYAKEQGDYAKNIGDTYDAAKLDKAAVKQATGTSTTDVMSQKAVTDTCTILRSKNEFIEREDTSFFEKGKNLFNKAEVVLNTFVNTTNGNLNSSASYWASDYIPVVPETQYCFSSMNRVAWYDLNKVFISGVETTETVITAPANAEYVRFSVIASTVKDTFQLEAGATPTTYEQYYNVIKEDAISKYIDGIYREKSVKLIADDLYVLERNKNLFIQEAATQGFYVNWNTGGLAVNALYYASEYIPVETETDYYNNVGSHYAIYDSNKAFISGQAGEYSNLIHTPANGAFIRISVSSGSFATAQLEEGTNGTLYTKGGYVFKPNIILHPVPEIVMPPKYTAVVGTPLQIFYQGLISTINPSKYNLVINCLRGKDFRRYWEFTPQVCDIGTYTLELFLYDDASVLVNSASTDIEVVQFVDAPASKINILTLGDSLNDGEGDWGDALAKQIVDGTNILPGLSPISNVDFIGELGDAPKQFTGHGGWSWADYTSEPNTATADVWLYTTHDKTISDQESLWKDTSNNIWQLETIEVSRLKFKRYGHTAAMPAAPASLVHYLNAVNTATINYTSTQTAGGNPFWDTVGNKVDFINWFSNKYPTKYSNGEVIDACFVLLGWNGGVYGKNTATDWATYILTAKTFIDNLHADYPSCKVYVMGIQYPSLNGGLGNNYGAIGGYLSSLWSVILSVQCLNIAYKNLCSEPAYSSFCQFINISGQFDSEYNMPYTMTPVNLRSSITERLGINGVHPSTDGYLQIADAALRVFVKDFCQ